jgi:DNA polymerase
MTKPVTRDDIRELMDWYAAFGITDWVGEAAPGWFALAEREVARALSETSGAAARGPAAGSARAVPAAPARLPQRASERPTTRPMPPVPNARPAASSAAPADDGVMAARAKAGSALTLEELREQLARFDGCGLKATAKSLCFYRGAAQARLMLIGEAPGREEDLQGKPFVGPAGQLLDRMLAAIGLDESGVHITNVVYWRPPGNRTPTVQETEACRPFLERQIELVKPDFVVLLGGAAAKHMLNTAEGIMRLRGTWRSITIGGREIPAIATLHPAYLLRTPAYKRQAWRDLLMIEAALLQP